MHTSTYLNVNTHAGAQRHSNIPLSAALVSDIDFCAYGLLFFHSINFGNLLSPFWGEKHFFFVPFAVVFVCDGASLRFPSLSKRRKQHAPARNTAIFVSLSLALIYCSVEETLLLSPPKLYISFPFFIFFLGFFFSPALLPALISLVCHFRYVFPLFFSSLSSPSTTTQSMTLLSCSRHEGLCLRVLSLFLFYTFPIEF